MASPPVSHAVDASILEPFAYISETQCINQNVAKQHWPPRHPTHTGETPGKDVRGALIDAFNVWLKIPPEKVTQIKSIISRLHNASLLVDDIEDGSQLRRGKPVAHAIFGVPYTLNAANYAYFVALEECHRLGSPEALSVFVEELLNLHRGQGQDIVWRDTQKVPSEKEYYSMVLDKTGGLFRLAVGLMAAFSARDKSEFRELVDQLALYFQIRDDLVNLKSDEYALSKSYCEDLTEGKFSYPILHAIRARPDDTRLLNILKQKTENTDVKRHAVEFMESVGSFEKTREALAAIKGDIASAIAALGGHDQLVKLVEKLDAQVAESSKPLPVEPLRRYDSL